MHYDMSDNQQLYLNFLSLEKKVYYWTKVNNDETIIRACSRETILATFLSIVFVFFYKKIIYIFFFCRTSVRWYSATKKYFCFDLLLHILQQIQLCYFVINLNVCRILSYCCTIVKRKKACSPLKHCA